MHPRLSFKYRAKPKSTRGRIALPGVDLQDRYFLSKGALVGCSELSLVAEFRACRQEIVSGVKKKRCLPLVAVGRPRLSVSCFQGMASLQFCFSFLFPTHLQEMSGKVLAETRIVSRSQPDNEPAGCNLTLDRLSGGKERMLRGQRHAARSTRCSHHPCAVRVSGQWR
ncbi:MAG: hypothetical protein CMH69_12455 [Nitratireductor sp.]|nr:hypothetical protein [Nitratireductor sp.]